MRGTLGIVAGLIAASWRIADAQPAYPVPHPHPMLTEVLFDVPQGADGDTNRDGQRDAAGDEFIEVANPYDHAINLKGYVLSSRLASPHEDTGKGVRFVFPDCELGPHRVALVFNGYGASIAAPVGTQSACPDQPNPAFAGALVFTIANTSRTRALRNSGDFVLLSAPDGTPLDCLTWGASSPAPPAGVARLAALEKASAGGAQRATPEGEMRPHADIDGRPFSPGEIPQP